LLLRCADVRTAGQADELANALATNGQVTVHSLPQYAEQLARFTALANDIVFPGSLTTRADFQDHFPRLQGKAAGTSPSALLVEAAARTPPEDRQPRDAETILNWLLAHKCLTHIPVARLMRLCERLRVRDVEAGTAVCRQGDVGDVSYISFFSSSAGVAKSSCSSVGRSCPSATM
jgi:hypothetical protein